VQFAEFLNQGSLDRLGILYLPTCVGLGYGHLIHIARGFSRQHGISRFASCGSASRLGIDGLPDLLNQGSLDRLGILYLPTCVGLGYGHLIHSLEDFLGSMGSVASPKAARHDVSGLTARRICLPGLPTRLPQERPSPGSTYPSASPHRWPPPVGSVRLPEGSQPLSTPGSAWARMKWYRNINLSSIAYASRPRLRSRLTLGG